jgi:hypothetical protein
MLPKKIRCPKCRSSELTLLCLDVSFDGRSCTVGGVVAPDELPRMVATVCSKCEHTFKLNTEALKPQIDTKALLAFMDEADVGLDWHEPPVEATIYGDHLDNACGNHVTTDPKLRRHEEYVVELHDSYSGNKLRINLASLLAEVCRLARKEG